MSRAPTCCPNCGVPVLSRQREWQLAAEAAGRCLRCNQLKPERDARFQNCTPCRRIISSHAKRRYAKKQGTGIAGAI